MAPGEAFCPFNRRQRSQRQTGWCRRQKSAGESGGRPVLQILSSPVAQMECSGLALSTATMAQTIDAGAVGLERRSGLQVLGWTAGQMVDGWMGRQGKVRYGTPAGGWTGVGAGDQVNDGERALLGQGRGSAGGGESGGQGSPAQLQVRCWRAGGSPQSVEGPRRMDGWTGLVRAGDCRTG